MEKHINFIFIQLIIILLLILNCDKESTKPTDDIQDAVTATKAGWTEFEKGNYEDALFYFEQAIEMDSSYTDAYNGAGWANALLNHLEDAVFHFYLCISLDDQHIDAIAGLAFVLNAQNEYNFAIKVAKEVLNIDSTWTFSHNSTLNAQDLLLLLAESYFALANFFPSLEQVKILNPNFSADVTTQEGVAALAAEIERLQQVL